MSNSAPGLPLGEPHPVIVPETGNALVSVCFLRMALPYNKGDIAGFPKKQADRLVLEKLAEYCKPPASPEAAAIDKSGGKQGKGKRLPVAVASVPLQQSSAASGQPDPSLLSGDGEAADTAESSSEGASDADNP